MRLTVWHHVLILVISLHGHFANLYGLVADVSNIWTLVYKIWTTQRTL